MSIKVGDRVRWSGGSYTVRFLSKDEACIEGAGGLFVAQLHNLTLDTPTPEPAPAPLTGAQVAQVLEAVADAVFTRPGGRDKFVGDEALLFRIRHNLILSASALRVLAERERDNAG